MNMIKIKGHIDSNNAEQFEKELMDSAMKIPVTELVLDAGELEYISSAGLRVLMKLRKQVKRPVPVVNVSPEIYEIFEQNIDAQSPSSSGRG